MLSLQKNDTVSLKNKEVKMEPPSPILTYTRAQLQGMKKEREIEEDRQNVKRLVDQIRQGIIGTASNGKTSYFHSWHYPTDPEDRNYKVLMTAIEELKYIFIDAQIKFDSQRCIRTGRLMNQGIYVDWS